MVKSGEDSSMLPMTDQYTAASKPVKKKKSGFQIFIFIWEHMNLEIINYIIVACQNS